MGRKILKTSSRPAGWSLQGPLCPGHDSAPCPGWVGLSTVGVSPLRGRSPLWSMVPLQATSSPVGCVSSVEHLPSSRCVSAPVCDMSLTGVSHDPESLDAFCPRGRQDQPGSLRGPVLPGMEPGRRKTSAPSAREARASVPRVRGDPRHAFRHAPHPPTPPDPPASSAGGGRSRAKAGGPCEAEPGGWGGGRIRREGMHPPGRAETAASERCLPLLAGAGKGAAVNPAQARCGEEASGSASRPTSACCFQDHPSCNPVWILHDSYAAGQDSQTNSSIVLERLVQGCFPNPSLPGSCKSPGLLFLLQRAGCISKLRGAEVGRDVKGTSKVSRALRLWQQDAGTGCH